jgi:hypothetical protein
MTSKTINTVTATGEAIVDGRWTALAGCARFAECPSAPRCLRADPKLVSRIHRPDGDLPCQCFIPIERVEP